MRVKGIPSACNAAKLKHRGEPHDAAQALPHFPLTRAAPAAGASTDLGEVGGAQRAEPASTDGWGQPYSNSIRHRTSAPRLPSDDDEMSFTLS